jgi:HK97 family phage prohead protease/HK97 family phage major capsid protein
MTDKTKMLTLQGIFTKSDLPSASDTVDSISIAGYASTTDIDRHGDVIPASVWEAGIQNYLKNPIILAYHDHCEPVGKMVEHRVDEKGLWVKARISAAAEDVFNLVKDGVLTAFSVGFRIMDAEYNSAAEVFIVKELELHEISVVSVPANQNTLFSLAKSFETDDEYKSFKMQFASNGTSAKGLENPKDTDSDNIKEFNMDKIELEKMLADAAKLAAENATKAFVEAQRVEAEKNAANAKAEADMQDKIKAAVAAQIVVGESGAEKLLADVEKRFAEQTEKTSGILAGLEASIKEKAAELDAIQKSKMQFSDSKGLSLDYAEREKAVLLSKMSGKALGDTKFGRQLIEKAGAHVPGAVPWELEVSLNMENEVRRRLVIAPTLRNIAMQTNVMTFPVNPEAGLGQWVTNAQFGTTDSKGNTDTHQLKEVTLNAYKVATNEYLAYEEEEDSLLAILPVVRDAMIRRVARTVDRAFLMGAGAGADPVKGLATYDVASTVTLDISALDKMTVAKLRAMRADLGAWGLNPSDIVFVVSTEGYYDLLEDTLFQTMDKVGTQATALTGQIGLVGNTPVLVSAELPAKADGAVGAICYAPANFLVGNQRGLRFDTQDLVETQRKVLVSSLRTGMTQITTNIGGGVSTLRYVA